MRLNLGAGMLSERGWVNADMVKFSGIDLVFNFNKFPWPIGDNLCEEIKIKDCIHCADNTNKFMEEVWRICKPNAIVTIEAVNFLSPINCQDPYMKSRIGWNTFDVFIPKNLGYYSSKAKFEIVNKKWIFSRNKYLNLLSPLFNIFPTFYARFTYFWLPCNVIKFKLKVMKEVKND